MKIAVASGKGGTGKTTVAVSLAQSLVQCLDPEPCPEVSFLDCDVEAPDAHLFLHPEFRDRKPAVVPIPVIASDFCMLCGDCAEVCRFNALAVLGEAVSVFPELCHGCGSCGLVCPTGAISEADREIGLLEEGIAGEIRFARGMLNVGEALAVPVIKQLKEWSLSDAAGSITILDSPPGTSCPMVETVAGADFVLLVTEPTPSGLHDLQLARDVLLELDIPAGVVVNRDGTGYQELEDSCAESGLPVLMRIPFERRVAEGLARGETLLEVRPHYAPRFRVLATDIEALLPPVERSPSPASAGHGGSELELPMGGRSS